MRDRVEQLKEALEENSDRLDEILKLLKKKTKYQCLSSDEEPEMTKKYVLDRSKTKKKRAASPSPDYSSDYSKSPSRKKKRCGQEISKDKFSRRRGQTGLEGEVKSGDDLLIVGVKTLEKIIEDGEDPLPCVKHLRMLAEKVSKNVYKVDSLCKYDSIVRKRAGLKGI